MSDHDVGHYQKSAITGHRPTWSLGHNPWSYRRDVAADKPSSGFKSRFKDGFGLFGEEPAPNRKPIRNAERKALSALGLDETAEPKDIKVQYKLLVKRHHPDANGGGKAAEEKLREIIQAYDYLKRAGFC